MVEWQKLSAVDDISIKSGGKLSTPHIFSNFPPNISDVVSEQFGDK